VILAGLTDIERFNPFQWLMECFKMVYPMFVTMVLDVATSVLAPASNGAEML
jgi:hypothetical protein